MTEDSLIDQNLPDGHRSGFVAVVGAPNAGKSTLINALLEQKIAIVSPRPQTTRARQLGILTSDVYQIIFVDTPGLIKKSLHTLDDAMVETVIESMDGADAILWMVDATALPNAADRELARLLDPLSKRMPVILAMNKVDMMTMEQVATNHLAYRQLLPEVEWIVFSAQQKAGLEELRDLIVTALPEGPRFYPKDQITDTFVRTIAGEMVREQILLQMHDEIPHTIAVEVDEFKERGNGTIYILAMIFVERDSHKRIVIGQDGKQIKKIGAAARREIEKVVDSKIYLELRVKTIPKWRRNRKLLERFGYAQ